MIKFDIFSWSPQGPQHLLEGVYMCIIRICIVKLDMDTGQPMDVESLRWSPRDL